MSPEKSEAELEWERRLLCSDEACIGTIGPDGRCKECGKPYEGSLPQGIDQPIDAEAAEDPDRNADNAWVEDTGRFDGEEAEEEADAVGDDEWSRRVLCSDESCIGVIGPDGRCKECGKPYEG